ncbi:acylphosphatase [Bauldia litoralis]|uniref:acylphosphatase n=1 Tax=Bauldia litoralis TaxID=665467 RepID=A0A1G6DA01_9HYPH|nr:acylphosphatase [Bauldia litoralis]SDB41958.1 acylphosphatase [Bauldia litoralis]
MADKTLHLRIAGRVQGVGYRAWLCGEARSRGLTGWVRNRSDDTVEAVVSGPVDAVEAMVRLCREGPPAALVSGVETAAWDETLPDGFNGLPTL